MRVANNSSVVKVVWAGAVWEEAMQNNHIAFLCNNCAELGALVDMLAVRPVDGRVEAFGVVVKPFNNA
jgi:hypothetical protein